MLNFRTLNQLASFVLSPPFFFVTSPRKSDKFSLRSVILSFVGRCISRSRRRTESAVSREDARFSAEEKIVLERGRTTRLSRDTADHVIRYCDSAVRSSIKRQIFKPNAAPALFALEIAPQRLYTCSPPLHREHIPGAHIRTATTELR